ncbi:MAG TPA: hypothetical protein VHC22_25760 [Pirellulales bacterium]|nr:hypothetical protein [Pirellulales bacterium]
MTSEERSQTDKRVGQGGSSQVQADRGGKQPLAAGTTEVSTSDPAIRTGNMMGGTPDQNVSYQTSQLSAPPEPYPFGAGGDVVAEARHRHKNKGGDRSGERRHGQGRGGGERKRDDEKDTKRDARPKQTAARPAVRETDWKSLALTAVVALACGMGGAWGYAAFFGSAKSDKQSQDSGKRASKDKSANKGRESKGQESEKAASESSHASASDIPGFTSADDAKTFRKELEHLSHRLDLLGGRIDQMMQPETQTPPVLHTLQNKVNDLEREIDRVASLPHKLERLQQSLLSTREEFKILKERVSGEEMPAGHDISPAGLESQSEPDAPLGSEAAAHSNPPAGTGSVIGTSNPAEEATLKLAIGLFGEGQYLPAGDVLRRLQREHPQDARVWYYSALANGLATGDWSGKTKRFAERGLACEKAGKPVSAEIDKSLASLPANRGREWLADQRRQVTTH